jgi:hypothetical protein
MCILHISNHGAKVIEFKINFKLQSWLFQQSMALRILIFEVTLVISYHMGSKSARMKEKQSLLEFDILISINVKTCQIFFKLIS